MSSSNNRREATAWYGNLVSWICNQGGEIHSALDLLEAVVADQSSSSACASRGIKATADIDEGTLLIRLPAKLALDGSHLPTTYEVKVDGSRDDDAVASKRMASPWLRCLTSLLSESAAATTSSQKRKAGEDDGKINFAPYLHSLPSSYDTLMDETSWPDDDVSALLAGTALGTLVSEERKADMTRQRYNLSVLPYLHHIGLSNSEKDYNDFKRACACVSTRGFHLLQEQEQPPDKDADAFSSGYSGPYLLPFIDLLNHSTEKKCTTLQRDASDGSFVMIAERKINAGEEVFHTYGTGLSSAQLLQTFGFVERAAERRAANNQWDDARYGITPVTLSAASILSACRSVKDSSFPADLKRAMEETGVPDETWDLPTNTPDRDILSHGLISNDILIDTEGPILSDELVTLCCLPFLPDDVYTEWSEEPCLWSADVLGDYFLAKLALRSLVKAVGAKLGEYTSIDEAACGLVGDDGKKSASQGESGDGNGDSALLARLLDVSDGCVDAKHAKATYGLTIRLEEKHCIDLLKKEIIDILKSLDDEDEGSGVFDEEDGGSGKRSVVVDDDDADASTSKKIKL